MAADRLNPALGQDLLGPNSVSQNSELAAKLFKSGRFHIKNPEFWRFLKKQKNPATLDPHVCMTTSVGGARGLLLLEGLSHWRFSNCYVLKQSVQTQMLISRMGKSREPESSGCPRLEGGGNADSYC